MLVSEFVAKSKTVILPQPPCSLYLILPADFYLLSKTEDPEERKAFSYDWVDKRDIAAAAVSDTKKRVSEMFRGCCIYFWVY